MPNYTINIDTLEIVLKPSSTAELVDRGNFMISNSFKPKEIKGFQKCNVIQFENQLFAKLYSGPTSRLRYLERDKQLLILFNESFYREGTFENVLPLFLKEYFYKATSIKKIHIAIDGPGIILRERKLNANEKYNRKSKITEASRKDKIDGSLSVTLGSYKSDKVISFYDKSREIDSSKKNYIRGHWHQNGMTPEDEPIDRMELRLRKSEVKGLEKNISLFGNNAFLASLFKNKAEGYLLFINKKNKKENHVIEWEQFGTSEIKKEKIVRYNEPTYRVKTCIKTLFLEDVESHNEQASSLAIDLAKKYNLLDWYSVKQKRWKKENPVFTAQAQ